VQYPNHIALVTLNERLPYLVLQQIVSSVCSHDSIYIMAQPLSLWLRLAALGSLRLISYFVFLRRG
jgi:hypothetical protein